MDTIGGRQSPPPSIPTRPVPIKANNQPNSSAYGYKISVRFGDQILQAGFTSVPNLVLNHYAKLGITPAEMLFTIHMWQFRWTERDPYPSLTTIADKMDVSWRQAHRYAKSLEQKGFLHIKSRQEPGRGQVTSEYDFEPLLKAVLKLDTESDGNPSTSKTNKTGGSLASGSGEGSTPLSSLSGGGMTELTEVPLTQLSDEEYKEQEDSKQKDVNPSNIRKATSLENTEEQHTTTQEVQGSGQSTSREPTQPTWPFKPHQLPREGEREQGKERGDRGQGFSSLGATLTNSNLKLPPRPYGEERQVIMDYVSRFAKDFNDQASLKTSTTRAYNLFTKSKLPLGGFIGRMYEAQAITKESAAPTPKRRNSSQTGAPPRGRPAKNRMAYWFSVLEDRLGLRPPKAGREESKGIQ